MPAHKLTKADWGKIHAKAYKDKGFRRKLETDPTAAVKEWFAEEYPKRRMTLDRIVDLSEWMKLKVTDEDWPPPACC